MDRNKSDDMSKDNKINESPQLHMSPLQVDSTMTLTWRLRTSGRSWRPRATRAGGGTAARGARPPPPAGRGGGARGGGRAQRRRGPPPGAGRMTRNSAPIGTTALIFANSCSYATRRKTRKNHKRRSLAMAVNFLPLRVSRKLCWQSL